MNDSTLNYRRDKHEPIDISTHIAGTTQMTIEVCLDHIIEQMSHASYSSEKHPFSAIMHKIKCK